PSSTGQVSAPIHRLSASQRPVFLINSRLGLFTAASHQREAPLLPKLRGHFAEFLNESSPAHLRILSAPTCVGLRYGHLLPRYMFFLAVWIRKLRYSFSLPITAGNNWTDLPIQLPHCLDAHIQRCAFPILLRLPITRTVTRWCRNIHLLTIAYAFRPRLRSRLTLSGRAFLRKP